MRLSAAATTTTHYAKYEHYHVKEERPEERDLDNLSERFGGGNPNPASYGEVLPGVRVGLAATETKTLNLNASTSCIGNNDRNS